VLPVTRGRFRPCCKLWLSSAEAEGIFGDGKWRLLAAVRDAGSLRAATGALGISYRKAWGDVKKAERELGVSLVERHRGGAGGGVAALTADGHAWLAGYTRFRVEIEEALEHSYAKHLAPLAAR
jgi:molybdate transport system regulatory protein